MRTHLQRHTAGHTATCLIDAAQLPSSRSPLVLCRATLMSIACGHETLSKCHERQSPACLWATDDPSSWHGQRAPQSGTVSNCGIPQPCPRPPRPQRLRHHSVVQRQEECNTLPRLLPSPFTGRALLIQALLSLQCHPEGDRRGRPNMERGRCREEGGRATHARGTCTCLVESVKAERRWRLQLWGLRIRIESGACRVGTLPSALCLVCPHLDDFSWHWYSV